MIQTPVDTSGACDHKDRDTGTARTDIYIQTWSSPHHFWHMSQNCCTAPTHKWMNEDLCEQASQFRVFKHNTFYIAWQHSVIDTRLRKSWILCNRNKIEELWTTPMPLSPDQRLTESMPQCRCRPLAALRQGRSSGQFCGGRHIPLLAAHRENLWSWSLHRHQIHWRLHSGKTCGHGLRPDTRDNMKVKVKWKHLIFI